MLLGVLSTIHDKGGCIVREVADENLISIPAASRMITDLVKKGFVIRKSDATDRRIVHLEITDAGEIAIQVIHHEAGLLLEKMLKSMNQDELDALEKGLLAFIRAMQENATGMIP